MKPATPLPWGDLYATTGALPARKREQDVAYALHAANAYPRLVAALRYIARGYSGDIGNAEGHSGTHCADHAAALLRELGEAE